jgi:carbonic anhydrase
VDRLCELNVIEQVVNVAQTTVVESAWARGQEVTIHGWIYSLNNGLVNDLRVDIGDTDLIESARDHAVQRLGSKD